MSARGAPGDWSYLAYWRNGEIDLDATRAGLPCNEFAAAKLLAAERPGEMHYVPPFSTWHLWDGQCHRPDDGGRHARVVLDLSDRYAAALGACRQEVYTGFLRQGMPAAEADKQADAAWAGDWAPAVKYAAALCKAKGISDQKKVLADVCSVSPAYMEDKHPEWLNTAGGTTDLRSGQTWAHRPADMLTYCLPVMPGTVWGCPRFLKMIEHVTGGSGAVAEYLMRVLGYSLLGDNREQNIWFLNGPTKSGKSQVLTIVRKILAALAVESKAALVTYVPHGRSGRVENSIRGARLVTINETSAIMHIEEGQLKRLTGETEIPVEQLYDKTMIYTKVSFVIVIATNEMPSVASMDPAISERVIVVPCGATIPPEYRVKGYAEQILAEEAPGILATLMHYAGVYLREGRLPMPYEVMEATEQYCQLQNVAAQFAADKLVIGCGWEHSIPGHQILKSAQEWARNDRKIPGRNQFYELLSQVDGITRQTVNRSAVFRGVKWKVEVPSNWL